MGMQKIGTIIIVLNNKKQILLGKRKNSMGSGYCGLPGGKIKKGEKLEECVLRELKEEVSLQAKEIKFLLTIKEWQEEQDHDFVHFIFVCKDCEGEVKLNEPNKCEGWKWYDLDKLPIKILKAHLTGIEVFRSGNNTKIIDL
jgi:8-oxo-dGTP diphosphatase